MGLLGRYIDGLTDEERDRVVRAKDWTNGTLLTSRDARCLVGHARGYHARMPVAEALEVEVEADYHGIYFDALCNRFSIDRIVRAIKLRAGARVEDLEIKEQRELVEV